MDYQTRSYIQLWFHSFWLTWSWSLNYPTENWHFMLRNFVLSALLSSFVAPHLVGPLCFGLLSLSLLLSDLLCHLLHQPHQNNWELIHCVRPVKRETKRFTSSMKVMDFISHILKTLRVRNSPFVCSDLCCSAITTTHTNVALLWLSCDAFALDSRQAFTTPSSTAGGTEWTDKHCRGSSRLQLQSPGGRSGLKVLLAKMLAAEVGVGRGDPLGAGALDLLLPFAKGLRVLGEFKQRHTIFWSFATSIGHTVIGHVVSRWTGLSMKPSPKQDVQSVHP